MNQICDWHMPKSDMSLATLNVDMTYKCAYIHVYFYYYSGLISLLEYKAIKYFFFALLNIPNFIDVHDNYIILMSFSLKNDIFFIFYLQPLLFYMPYVFPLFVILGWKPSTCMLFQFVFKPIYITKCVQTEQNGRPRGHTSHLGQKSYRSSTLKSNTKYMENWVQ